MMPHIRTGEKGEKMAADWLTANGFQILRRNWRHGRYEVDLIAGKEETIHIVEVKCRQSNAYGPPEQSVSRKKIEHLLRGAQGWLLNHPGLTRIQYDVLAITLHKDADPEYFLFEDVYL
jgi:putative endonuclease